MAMSMYGDHAEDIMDSDALLTQIESKLRGPFTSIDFAKAVSSASIASNEYLSSACWLLAPPRSWPIVPTSKTDDDVNDANVPRFVRRFCCPNNDTTDDSTYKKSFDMRSQHTNRYNNNDINETTMMIYTKTRSVSTNCVFINFDGSDNEFRIRIRKIKITLPVFSMMWPRAFPLIITLGNRNLRYTCQLWFKVLGLI